MYERLLLLDLLALVHHPDLHVRICEHRQSSRSQITHKGLLVCRGRRYSGPNNQGPDLPNILRQSYDYLTIMPKLRSTYDGRLFYKTSYSEWQAFHR